MGTPVGPGKDTHGTLGPDQREGRGWPEHSSAQQYSAETLKTLLLFWVPRNPIFFWPQLLQDFLSHFFSKIMYLFGPSLPFFSLVSIFPFLSYSYSFFFFIFSGFFCISFKCVLFLALVSEFNCFLRSRCSMEMWCLDGWDWLGPPAWERACFNSP